MELLWAIFLIVVVSCLYTGYRFGRWKERRHQAKAIKVVKSGSSDLTEVHP